MNTIAEPRLPFDGSLMRSLAVGLAYALASALAAVILGPLSRLAPSIDNFFVWLISGTLVTLALSLLIRHSAWSRRDTTLAV
jgi:hypothetical protein